MPARTARRSSAGARARIRAPARCTSLQELKVKIPYRPRPVQRELHDAVNTHKKVLLVWHRRAGKTVAVINQLIKSALTCSKPRARFTYIAPFLKQAKALAWDYLVHYSSNIPGVTARVSELTVTYPNGGQVRLFGADNPDSLREIGRASCRERVCQYV